MKQIPVLPIILCLLSACAHKGPNPEAADMPCSASGEQGYIPIGEVMQKTYQGEVIYSYKNYFFAKIPPEKLADFIKQNSIQMLIDLRMDGSDQGLTSEFPAVYWHHPFEKISSVDHKKIQELKEHLEAFSDKVVIFVSNDGDAAVAAFTKYWAEAHSLNNAWVSKTSSELGLKERAWLKKWDDLQTTSKEDRSSASEN